MSDPRTNDRIRVPEVRLVGPAGEQVGVVRIEDALRLAQEADLDLVEVAPNSKPPVAKIMDFGKFKYETAQKAKEARRHQANTILKEVRFRLKIDVHDYETKRKRAEGFLKAGDKVKAMILFRGREQSRPDQGVRLLQRFAADVAEFGSVESTPMIDGRNMVMVIGPIKNKSEAKAEAEAKRASAKPTRDDRPAETPEAARASSAFTEALEAQPPMSAAEAKDAGIEPAPMAPLYPVREAPTRSAPARSAAPASRTSAPSAAPAAAPRAAAPAAAASAPAKAPAGAAPAVAPAAAPAAAAPAKAASPAAPKVPAPAPKPSGAIPKPGAPRPAMPKAPQPSQTASPDVAPASKPDAK
ncbi:MAG: translation initiation factor IF-3 [Burkholderiaceae bacterium]|nr:translation initiation factor IF-3 [Microbacteriaceae bacterium]